MGGEEGKLEERIQDIFDRSLFSHLDLHFHLQSLDDRDHTHSTVVVCYNLSLGGSDHQNTKEQATLKVSLMGCTLRLLLFSSQLLMINLNSLGLEEEEEAGGKQVKLRNQVFRSLLI